MTTRILAPALIVTALVAAEPLRVEGRGPGAAAVAGTVEVRVIVRYVSAEHVYLDGGARSGLAVGDTLTVERDSRTVARVVVAYVADHSASALVVGEGAVIRSGDVAVGRAVVAGAAEPPGPAGKEDDGREIDSRPVGVVDRTPGRAGGAAAGDGSRGSGPPLARLSGSATFEWLHVTDDTESDLDFDQPTFRLDVRAREILGGNNTLRLKLRLRHHDRARSFSSSTPESEWRDRVYLFSLSHESPDGAYDYQVGRISAPTAGGFGLLDGIVLARRVSDHARVGVFGGAQPDWRDAAPQAAIQKGGAFVRYTRGSHGSRRFDGSMAVAGEYHGSIVSREFVFVSARLESGRRWSVYQSAEIDVNRGWRRERAGDPLAVSNYRAGVQIQPSEPLRLSVAYDSQSPYLTYETRDLPDRLFIDTFTQGLRARLSARATRRWQLSVDGGLRRRENDDRVTRTWGVTTTGSGVLGSRSTLIAQVSGFSGELADGLRPSATLRRKVGPGLVGVTGGAYAYDAAGDRNRRTSYWLGGTLDIDAVSPILLGADYEYRWGDDLSGHQIAVESGYRF